MTDSSQQALADLTSTLASPQHALAPRKSVPDLDAILSELSCTPDYNATFMTSALSTDDDDVSYWDMDARDQFVHYEECAERARDGGKGGLGGLAAPDPVSPNTAYSDKLLEKISCARAMLDLPSSESSRHFTHRHS